MKSSLNKIWVVLLFSSLLVTACNAIGGGTPEEAEPTEIPIVIADTEVIAEGSLVPKQFVNLSFTTGGQVVEVLVEEGDKVTAGQVIARLDQNEQLISAVAGAELELLNARQALEALLENADVTAALARQAVADARDAVRDAERYLNNLKSGSLQTDIDSAEANLILLRDNLEKAKEDYQPYANKPEDNLTRAALLSKMADAQRKYNNAVRLFNNLLGTASEIDIAIAEANLAVAQAQLAIAEQDYEEVQNGPDPDDLAAAEARVKAAEAGLHAAQAALDDNQLVAPFAGTVVDLGLKLGEQVAPGQPVVMLADFSTWYVETDDLTEIEVPEIKIGQAATIVPDALPDLELQGTVERIDDLFQEKRGDVTYTARIRLNEVDERLRWGMTVVVTFVE